MQLFAVEHSAIAYRIDFALYGLVTAALAVGMATEAPPALRGQLLALTVAGLLGWTLAEYLLHRFVLHGIPPFKHWHAEHHRRPMALMGSPTVLSAALFLVAVFLPAWWLGGAWRASALTCGMLSGYLAYAIIHHATHHSRSNHPWLLRRKRWHALHHAPGGGARHYGVCGKAWDLAFGTAR
jgi:sterol desaturase/sphingolipid hydroxylase (fatty acid hydroxylase superfamily)